MIRTLEDYITSDAMENEYNEEHPFVATEIPLDDKKVIELFHGTEILGIKPEDIYGCKLGCLGIPEFGTDCRRNGCFSGFYKFLCISEPHVRSM